MASPSTTRPGPSRPASRRSLRPRRFDDLGLKRALADRLLPLLVGAMAFLAALTIAGAIAAASLAAHWQKGAAAALTVQVPQPEKPAIGRAGTRLDAALSVLRGIEGVASASALPRAVLDEMLKPWLGDLAASGPIALPIPAVIAVQLGDPPPPMQTLTTQLAAVAPGTMVESHGFWVQRLTSLARSLQACAAIAFLIVLAIAVAVIAVATRAGLAARRDAIEIVHGLGATDSFIANRFASRVTTLAGYGGLLGAAISLPVMLGLAGLAAPFATWVEGEDGILAAVPIGIWIALPCLPLVSAAIGWITAQVTVRSWLRRLP